MITANEALKIYISNHIEIIERKIKEAAEKSLRQLCLKGCIGLSPEEKEILQDNGFKITIGHSGKGGDFYIISW